MSDGFLLTLSSKYGQSTERAGSAYVHEVLYKWGLEWKTADQFHDSEVVITIRPYDDDAQTQINELESRLAKIAEVSSGE